MAKITRQTQQIFASNAPSNLITAFGTAMTSTPNYTTDVSEIMNANFLTGWSSAIQPDKAPYEEDTNGVLYAITRQLAYLYQSGIAEWDANTEYYAGDYCRSADGNKIYVSKADNNTNHAITDSTYWKEFLSGADKDLSNLTQTGEKHFLNKRMISNCILEAPNGVIDFTVGGTTLTVKNGLKVLLPYGRNSDLTLNHNEFTVAADNSMTINSAWPSPIPVFLSYDGTLTVAVRYYEQEEEPTTLDYFWYSTTENKMYRKLNGSVYQLPAICLGVLTHTQGVIDNLSLKYPVMLNEAGRLEKSYVNGTSWYRIYSDNFCEQGGLSSTMTVSLLIPYADKNYTISVNSKGPRGGNSDYQVQPYPDSVSQFSIGGQQSGNGCYWVTRGYIS